MTLPSYIVIGAQKSATSTLCDLLGRHPQLFMCDPKEPYFFSHDDVRARGLAWYESLFAGAAEGQLAGEGSTTYSMVELFPHAAERLHATVPDARLLFIARDPLERIRSHWMHKRSRPEGTDPDFAASFARHPDYVDNSCYHRQLEVYRDLGMGDRMHVMLFEDFVRDRDAVLRGCFRFLGVDEDVSVVEEDVVRHRGLDLRVDTGPMRILRRVPGFAAVRRRLPDDALDPVRRLLRRPIEGKPEWTPAAKADAVACLYDDSRAFLESLGRPLDVWPWVAEEAARRGD